MDSTLWANMFHLTLSVLEKVARPVMVYLFLVIALRLAGKRELAQINSFDLVVLLMLSNTVQNAIIGEDNSVTGGVIGGATLLIVNYIVVRYVSRHPRVAHLIEGTEDPLIEHGRINEERMKRELISKTDLEMAARKQGFDSLAEVESAVLEPNGSISFIGRKPAPEEVEYKDVVDRLARIESQLAMLVEAGKGRES